MGFECGCCGVYNKIWWFRFAMLCWGSACKRRGFGGWPMGGSSRNFEEEVFPLLLLTDSDLTSLSRCIKCPSVFLLEKDHNPPRPSHSASGTWTPKMPPKMPDAGPARSQRLLKPSILPPRRLIEYVPNSPVDVGLFSECVPLLRRRRRM